MAWEDANKKMEEGKQWTDTIPVPFGDDTIELTYSLLPERKFWDVQKSLDFDSIQEQMEGENAELAEAEERLQELLAKDELTEAEEQELQEIGRKLNTNQADFISQLGDDAFNSLLNAGKEALTPSDIDIENGFDLSPTEQENRFGFVPKTREQMRDALELEMQEQVEGQPYPVKFIVGQAALAESMSLLGATDVNTGNPMSGE